MSWSLTTDGVSTPAGHEGCGQHTRNTAERTARTDIGEEQGDVSGWRVVHNRHNLGAGAGRVQGNVLLRQRIDARKLEALRN